MKYSLLTTLMISACCIISTCAFANAGIIDFFTSNRVDWEFIQSVGGMTIGEPQEKNINEWFIPINCNVSGTIAITTKPTAVNSALALKAINTKVTKNTIQLWVTTCLVTDKYNSPESTGITLRDIDEGHYQIEYLNSDGSSVPVSSVDIKSKEKT